MKLRPSNCPPRIIGTYLLYAILIILTPYVGFSQSKLFIGVISDFWDVPGNWNPVGIPTANDSVIISGSDTVEIPAGFVAHARFVDIDVDAGLLIDNSLMPFLRAELTIKDSPGNGFWNQGFLENKGILNLINVASHGIHNLGIVHNGFLGRITIDSIMGDGIVNLDSIHNQGLITIQNVIGATSNGISNSDRFLNQGKIEVTNVSRVGITSGSWFENQDSILVSNFNQNGIGAYSGIEVFTGGIWNNDNTGVIMICDGGPVGLGLYMRGDLTNRGHIFIKDLVNQGILFIVAGAEIMNEGLIDIKRVTLAGIRLLNATTFTQSALGSLLISNVTGNGIEVDLGAEVDLNGEVDIN